MGRCGLFIDKSWRQIYYFEAQWLFLITVSVTATSKPKSVFATAPSAAATVATATIATATKSTKSEWVFTTKSKNISTHLFHLIIVSYILFVLFYFFIFFLYIGKDGIFKIRVQLSDQIFHQTQIRIYNNILYKNRWTTIPYY